jgi:hypothetical protein
MHKRTLPRIMFAAVFALLTVGAHAQGRFEPPPPKPAPQSPLQLSYPVTERRPVILNAGERSYMLNEMRYYLDMLWVVTDALSRDDFGTVARAARRRGYVMEATRIPPPLDAKLPADYRSVSQDTYKMVDTLAEVAESSNDRHAITSQLARLLHRCNECHASYQYRVE